MTTQLPDQFELFNNRQTKNLIVVVEVDGLDDVLSSAPVFTTIRYGDPITYGESGIVYGGLRPYVLPNGGTFKSILSIDHSSLGLSQTCEPEQGRSSISQLSVSFIDLDGYMTRLCSPGIILPEILGRGVKVYIGYSEISFPDQFLLVFRGVIQTIQTMPGLYTWQLGDPNVKRRQSVFFMAQTSLTAPVAPSDTSISVINTKNFHKPILGPDGNYDPAITCYLLINNEVISYTTAASIASSTSFSSLTRAARATSAGTHAIGDTVTAAIQIGNNVTYPDATGLNCIDLALKIMLSGWNGPFMTDIPIQSIVFTGGPSTVDNAIVLQQGTNAIQDLGLSIGDYVTISGDTIPANNGTFIITDFQDLNGFSNEIIIVNGPLFLSASSPALLSLRSQYDTFPITCGVQMLPSDVDVAKHQFLKASILSPSSNNYSFYLTSEESSAKQFIEEQVYLPVGCYSVTRRGQCSVNITLPPIADQTLISLTKDNVLTPTDISVQRSTSNRNFFNEVDWTYDPDDSGTFLREYDQIDVDSISLIGLSSVLPISSNGVRNSITSTTVINERIQRFLNRFTRAAILISLKVNFGTSNVLSPGDIILLVDNGNLKIPNFTNGTTNLGTALYEIRNWALDIKSGIGTLQLLSSNNFTTQDRFATWAPSSYCAATGNTTQIIRVVPSFGAVFGVNEYKKWSSYIGMTLLFHNQDFTVSSTAILSAISASNVMTLSTPLSFTPDDTTIVDFDSYPTSTDPTVDAIEKQVHCFWDRSAPVTSSTSATVFNVGASDVQYFNVGFPIVVHKPNWSNSTFANTSTWTDGIITDITGTQITITNPNSGSYTPAAGDLCEILAFNDKGLGYRFV